MVFLFSATLVGERSFSNLSLFCLQLRENIAQDQEKSEFLKAQIKELERNIEGIENKILHAETTLKELRKLQDQISTRTTARSTLYKLQQTQYAALAEENEGSSINYYKLSKLLENYASDEGT